MAADLLLAPGGGHVPVVADRGTRSNGCSSLRRPAYEAIATVPSQMVADISLVGPAAKVRDDLAGWEEAGVTTLVVGTPTSTTCAGWPRVILG